MRYAVCVVRDSAADAFGVPMFMASVGQVLRSFSDEVNRKAEGNQLNLHPEDFELFHFGWFEDATGRFDLFDLPRSIGRAADLVVKVA